jgi:cell cycle checkpoint protein
VISKAGFEISVEEVRTLCGKSPLPTFPSFPANNSATAWIPTTLFDSFTYRPPPSQNASGEEEPSEEPSCFEISLDALLQCLNIFGNAAPGGGSTSSIRIKRRMAGEVDRDPDELDDSRVSSGGKGRGRTGMRMTWNGPGHDLDVLL